MKRTMRPSPAIDLGHASRRVLARLAVSPAAMLSAAMLSAACGGEDADSSAANAVRAEAEAGDGLGPDGSQAESGSEPVVEVVEVVEVELLTGTHDISLQTSLGTITLEIDADAAPLAATNFVLHTRSGYYDGVTFHRVIPGFMIQGGDPLGTGAGGESVFGGKFADEFDNGFTMDRGVIAMANRGPDTNGSQFFIVQAQAGTPSLLGKHTIFGHVIEGMDVVDAIATVARDEDDRPLSAITITPVEL